MALYWPSFEFGYTLDMVPLLPHLAAIEGAKAASASRVLPPPWREQYHADTISEPLSEVSAQGERVRQIQERKQELVRSNSSRAHAWVRQRFAPGSAPISLDDILTMHRMVAEEAGIRYNNVGVFRKEGQRVVVGETGIGVHAGAPPTRLPALLDDYILFVNSDTQRKLPAAVHALAAHFFLTTIHPFEDGSGRVSRLVAAAILFQRGYRGHGLYALSAYFYENETQYHAIIFELQQTVIFDLTRFVAFGLEGLVQELHGINSFMKLKLDRATERAFLTPSLRKKAEMRRSLLGLA